MFIESQFYENSKLGTLREGPNFGLVKYVKEVTHVEHMQIIY